MDNRAKDQLSDLYKQEGDRITRDAHVCEALLRDVCGDCRKEIAVLTGAVKCGVPLQLMEGRNSVPPDILRRQMVNRMEQQGGYDTAAAGWAVEAWQSVLDGPPTPTAAVESGGAKRIGGGDHKTTTLPPPEPVIAAFRARKSVGSSEANKARTYVREGLAGGKTVEMVRDEMVQSGYPRHIAEAVIWTGSLSQKRGSLMTQAMTAFGIAFLLMLASVIVAGATGMIVTLGGWAMIFCGLLGFFRLRAALKVPNFAPSYRQALSGKDPL